MFYIWEFILIDLMQNALRVHFKNQMGPGLFGGISQNLLP